MKEYTAGKLVSTAEYQSTVHFSKHGGYTAADITLPEAKKGWWRDAKIGMFVHWGLYAVHGKGEWDYFNSKWEPAEYEKLIDRFNPVTSPEDIAKEWIDTANSIGAKYAVMVTRHHDGFAMWNSDASWQDYCAGKRMGRDYVKAYVDACRAGGVHPGLYYSPMDWRFPGYFDPDGQPESAQAMKRQCHAQIDELMSRYGKVDVLWFDGGWLAHKGRDMDAAWLWDPIELCRNVRKKQPGIMISPRCGYVGDFQCDEGAHEVKGEMIGRAWEKCMTTGDAWGYQPDAMVYEPEFIIKMLANAICRGGNLLLNVGPDADGHIPAKVKALFKAVGEFVTANAEGIYGTRAGIFAPVDDVYGSVFKDDSVYLHILDRQAFSKLTLPATAVRFVKCHTLDGRQVKFTQNADGIKVVLPDDVMAEDSADLVLRLCAEKPIRFELPMD